jgi:hypothetical protein
VSRTICLRGASLTLLIFYSRTSAITAEGLEEYRSLIKNATDDLEDHLQSIDEKLEVIIGRSVTGTGSENTDLRLIREERKSTQKCLQICAQLSQHINQIQPTPKDSNGSPESLVSDSVPVKLTFEGLQECKEQLTLTTAKLEKHLKDRIDEMVTQMKAKPASEAELAEVLRLQEEWDTARQCIDICSKANVHLTENVTTVDNYANGDAIQFIVSTDGSIVHGKNRGLGWRTRQAGGHMNDASLQQLSRDFTTTIFKDTGNENQPPRGNTPPGSDDVQHSTPGAEYKRYGRGHTLASKAPADVPVSSVGSGKAPAP